MGKHKKSSKKEKKRSKKRASSSSSEHEWVETESVETNKVNQKSSRKRYSSSSSESSAEELIKKRKSRRDRRYSSSSSDNSSDRSLKKKKESTKRKYESSSSTSLDDEVYKKQHSDNKQHKSTKGLKDEEATGSKRDEWMDLSTSFSSFSNIDRKKQKEHDKKIQKQSEQYDPSKCSRELNPYWKDGGDGLPKFQKPKYDSDEDDYKYKGRKTYVKSESNWRKSKSDSTKNIQYKKHDSSDAGISKESRATVEADKTFSEQLITEKDLNLLAGRLVKAEIMGNEKLVKELKEKLEKARKTLEEAKSQDEEVLLTQTDRQGHSKPLTLQSHYSESSGGKKQRKKAVETHKDNQRVRYFPDDDKYSLKQMFENERFNTTHDQNKEFVRIASKIRKNDDLDDLFADDVRRKKSDAKIDEANYSKAVTEHKNLAESLDNCSKCIQSSSMQKHLIISMGEYVYLSVPSHEPLAEGHCLIVPIRHVPCVTQLDENEWSEILDFRKALVRLAQSKDEDPIFFEIATGLHRYPHMVLECVPIEKEQGDMAPIYFKKAIDESETEWAQNKKLVSLKGRDVRRAIPKGLPYFSVSFGMEEGFAHVIEDERLFPRNFAQEIIGGMLDLHHSKWRKPGRQSFSDQSKRVLEFSNNWKDFDCTLKS